MASDGLFPRPVHSSERIFLVKQSTKTLSLAGEPAARRQLTPTPYGFARGVALNLGAALFAGMAAVAPAAASSHMDAPLITLDPAANTTDVYAFLSQDPTSGQEYLTTALSVYPFEEPGIGPNLFRFDDRVLYNIHVSLDADIGRGKPDLTYRFQFKTDYANSATILSYLGVVEPKGKGRFPDNQNLRQSYTVTLIDERHPSRSAVLGAGIAPPNNQGRVTKYYNQNNDGDKPAKPGVAKGSDLDPYTLNTIFELQRGYRAFAGQRDDGFYADIQSIFDLDFSFGRDRGSPTKPFDSQGGFNVHTIVLNIPLTQLAGAKIAGVYSTTSRSAKGLARSDDEDGHRSGGRGEIVQQVGRQGNPLFNEALVAKIDKDLYNETQPNSDAALFAKYADNPELARALGATPIIPGLLRSIFIPDLIKVDLTTPPARLAGGQGFNRLGVFGGDVLKSTAQDPFHNGGLIPGGWPNGRRFGDDVVNIALIALGAAGPFGSIDPNYNGARVNHNDESYNSVFPYAATPHNGRNIAPPSPGQY
jgi:hypothetical protein